MPPKTPDRRTQPAPAKPRPVTTNRAYRPRGENPLKRNIQTQLTNEIGRGIVSGGYPPETILPNEAEMRARFSVSRTVLREAYSSLAAKGLIAARPKVGTRVRPKSDWNMLDPEVLAWHIQTLPNENLAEDLYVLRGMVEPPAAALAAADPAPATIKRIADAYADMVRFKDGTGDLVAADLEFHMAILQATGNYFIGALGALIPCRPDHHIQTELGRRDADPGQSPPSAPSDHGSDPGRTAGFWRIGA